MNILAVSGAPLITLLLQNCGTRHVHEYKSPEETCRENMMKLDGSSEQYALEYKKRAGTTVTAEMMVDHQYLRQLPVCPTGGTYNIIEIGKGPSCTVHGELGQW